MRDTRGELQSLSKGEKMIAPVQSVVENVLQKSDRCPHCGSLNTFLMQPGKSYLCQNCHKKL